MFLKVPLAALFMDFMLAAMVAGVALLAVETPIAVMAAAIALQPAWKFDFAVAKSLFSLTETVNKILLKERRYALWHILNF